MGNFRLIRFRMNQLPLVVEALTSEAGALDEANREYAKSLRWIAATVKSYIHPGEENTVLGLALASDVIEALCTQLSSNTSTTARQIKQTLKGVIK